MYKINYAVYISNVIVPLVPQIPGESISFFIWQVS